MTVWWRKCRRKIKVSSNERGERKEKKKSLKREKKIETKRQGKKKFQAEIYEGGNIIYFFNVNRFFHFFPSPSKIMQMGPNTLAHHTTLSSVV